MRQTHQLVPPPGAYAVGSVPAYGTIFQSSSRGAATYNSDPMFNPGWPGVKLTVDVSVHNSGTVTVKIQTKDNVSGQWIDLAGATTAALSGSNQTVTLTIYPGLAETANVDVSTVLPQQWRVVATVASAAVTFSVGGEYLG